MNPLTDYPFFSGEKPRILGHRGAAGVAPENTLVSIQRAFDDGAQFVEFDVRGTKDGEVVIIHDATLGRTTNGHGRVSQKKLKELKLLHAGWRFSPDGGGSFPHRSRKIEIPTLDECFSSFPSGRAIIEIKHNRPPIVKKVIQSVCRRGKDGQVLLATESDRIIKAIRRELKKNDLPIATGFSSGEVADFMAWLAGGKNRPYTPPGQAFQLPSEYAGMTLVSKETVHAAHELGIEMFVWTVNEVEEMERLLKLGVDGIITDYPKRLRDLLAAAKE